MDMKEYVVGDQLPEGSISIPLKAGDPDGDRVIIPNFDMSKINVTRVVLQMGHPCTIKQAGTRKQRRKTRKPLRLSYLQEVDNIAQLKLMYGMKPGEVVYVTDPEVKQNFVFIPDTEVAYNSGWYRIQLVPAVVDGKIVSCEVRLFQDQKVQAAF